MAKSATKTIKTKTKSNKLVCEINAAPMVDVMLVLLIIFMVITPMLQKGVSVELAKAENPREMREADQDDAVVVAVTRDGKIYLGSEQLRIEQLSEKIQDLLASKVDKTIYVKSDRRAKYGGVVDVVDTVRASGVDTLGLLTDKTEKKTTSGL